MKIEGLEIRSLRVRSPKLMSSLSLSLRLITGRIFYFGKLFYERCGINRINLTHNYSTLALALLLDLLLGFLGFSDPLSLAPKHYFEIVVIYKNI